MGLYRPTVTRKRKDGTRYREKARYWWGRFRHSVSGKTVSVPLKTADKSAAKTLLAEAERRAAREAAGLTNPYEEHQAHPLAEHLRDWESALVAKGNTPKHVGLVTTRARAVVDGCRFTRWRDISASRVLSFIGDVRSDGMSVQTCNFYLQAIKQFCRWMVRDSRAPESPVAHLSGDNVRTDRRHDRRALEPDELRWLLRTTTSGPPRYHIDGAQRALTYRLAVETGLRSSEIRSLAWRNIDLDGNPPTVTVPAAYSKRRRDDTLPLTAALADMLTRLRDSLEDAGLDDPIVRMPHSTNVVRMWRADLEAARGAWIEDAKTTAERRKREASESLTYRNAAGQYADFHSLRHTFITNLARAGVPPKVAQDLARHSDINLTLSRYSHTVIADQAAALKVLPDLTVTSDEDGASPATNVA